jgi:biotin carboxylase
MILGAGVMQVPAIRIAGELGLETVVVAGSAPCAGADGNIFEQIDLKDKEAVAAFALSLRAERGGRGLSGVMTAGTDFSATAAWVAERTGLPGIPYEAALNASDKERMRRRFKEAFVPSPEFLIIDRTHSKSPQLPFPYPVVVKPVDNMGARGCKRADNGAELRAAVNEALDFSRSGRAIVEEYMDGPEYSIDAIVCGGRIVICGFADRHICFPPYFIETGHTIPALIDRASASAIIEVFRAGARSLGITRGAAKGDMKLTSKGPMVGEIAARLSGGYMSGWTYPYSSGAEPTKAAILAAIGRLDAKKPQGLRRKKNWVSAERAFISIPGHVDGITLMESAKNNRYVKNIFFRVKSGDRVCFPENNVSKCGNVVSAAPVRALAVQAAEDAARGVLIRLSPHDAETDAFLSSAGASWPPDAFAASDGLLPALNALPCGKSGLRRSGALSVVPFPAFMESGAVDYAGRAVAESFAAVRLLTGLPLPFDNEGGLGREFWAALLRGGYQGAAYLLDSLP